MNPRNMQMPTTPPTTPEEMYQLGDRLFQGGNATDAVTWFYKAARKNHPKAQYALGACYYEGQGVPRQDKPKAIALWRTAADQDDPEAQYNLGACYYTGDETVRQDIKTAISWFEKAARHGQADAQYALGYCYYNGFGVYENRNKAIGLLRQAAGQGHADAQALLDEILRMRERKDDEPLEFWNFDATERYMLLGTCGHGGEGTTYKVVNHPNLLAKIYTPEALERQFPDVSGNYIWRMQEKVSHMVAIASKMSVHAKDEGDGQGLAVAWPIATLFDGNGSFVGFLMPRISSATSDEIGSSDLHFAYRPRERKYLFGDAYSWLMSIRIARNLAYTVQCLHENGIIIGDFNCNNILIDEKGSVTLIDADSFSLHNALKNITYRCVVSTGDFLAPELQGVDFADSHLTRTFTRESDCFSLAIHVFMLLMNGVHPFAGIQSGKDRKASSSQEPFVSEIANGQCPYVTGSPLAPFVTAPQISRFPYYIRALFDRVFGYANPEGKITKAMIGQRPTAEEWRVALERLYGECLDPSHGCPVDRRHYNLPGNYTCMWCELEGRLTPLERRKQQGLSSPYGRLDSPGEANGKQDDGRDSDGTLGFDDSWDSFTDYDNVAHDDDDFDIIDIDG